MKLRYIKIAVLFTGVVAMTSCKKTLDINYDPDRLPDTNSPIEQLLTSAQVNLGFEGGSDLYRYTTLIMQQMSGGASQPNQTYEYYRHNITGSDMNNLWSSIHATTLSDLELIIKQGGASPYYTGIAKILKAYEYSLVVDVWGDVPYSQTQQLSGNTSPVYDDDATIYPKLIQLLADAVNEINASSSALTPGNNSVIYTGTWATVKTNWIKLANTLRLRLLLHYSKINPTFCVQQITALVNTAGIQFMASNADNFQMRFYNVANQRNPISAFEVSRPNYLFADARMLSLMGAKNDPRRAFYFTDFPLGSGSYVGVSATALPPAPNNNYSRIHTFLRGPVTTPAVGTNSAVYAGDAPQRMLSYAEYCFIRAEAALMGAPGNAQTFFTDGITASMTEAGVSAANITTYLTANGTLTGTNAQKLQQIIEEKYVALFGVSVEPWTDWRRTGYPSLPLPTNSLTGAIPRTLFYPQSEIDLNPNCPGQKAANLQSPVFWDN
ncbi:MAG: SusD/RagB family nutrient-binding outer membrane lipoprotein [Chitinophagaceae bacterium]|nr:SusD/RagB family nutrient-binding outer membrane lipoprotein [Chitinophagaceae bacterium]